MLLSHQVDNKTIERIWGVENASKIINKFDNEISENKDGEEKDAKLLEYEFQSSTPRSRLITQIYE
jgi:hypothetical protein